LFKNPIAITANKVLSKRQKKKSTPFLTPDAALHFDCTACICTTVITVT